MQENTFLTVYNRDLLEFIVKRMSPVKKKTIGIPSCAFLSTFECIPGAFWSTVVANLAFIKEVWAGGHSEWQMRTPFCVQVSRPDLFLWLTVFNGVSCLFDLPCIPPFFIPTLSDFPLYCNCIELKRKLGKRNNRNITSGSLAVIQPDLLQIVVKT